MRLHRNWKKRLRRAWSVRLMLVGAILTGLQGVLPLLDLSALPPWAFTTLALVIFVAAPVAVAFRQENIDDGE